MRVLASGTKAAIMKLVLDLHRRNWHKHPDKIKAIFERAGVPTKTAEMVHEACALCGDCRKHQTMKAEPKVSFKLVARFNHDVFFDLVFS